MSSTLPVLDEEVAMAQVCGERDFLLELLNDLLGEEEKMMGDLRKALEENDISNYWKHAHGIKGAAANLGCAALSESAKTAEMTGRSLEKAQQEGVTEIKCPLEKGPVVSAESLKESLPQLVENLHEEFRRLEAHVASMQ